MAKKSNRPRPKAATKKASEPEPVPIEIPEAPEPVVEARVLKSSQAAKPKRQQATAERLEDEYAYIVGDLRRVLILAGLMFILLIVANLVLSRVAF